MNQFDVYRILDDDPKSVFLEGRQLNKKVKQATDGQKCRKMETTNRSEVTR